MAPESGNDDESDCYEEGVDVCCDNEVGFCKTKPTPLATPSTVSVSSLGKIQKKSRRAHVCLYTRVQSGVHVLISASW
jgi:hypothetical protein